MKGYTPPITFGGRKRQKQDYGNVFGGRKRQKQDYG